MKKQHIFIIVNILLIVAILFGVGVLVFNSNKYEVEPSHEESTLVATKQEAKPNEIEFKLGIIQHTNNSECNACYEGFVAKLAQRGYVNSNNVKIDYVLEENEKKCISAIEKMVNDGYDIIYSIGVFTTGELSTLTKDIPIVFAAVSDPESEGFVASNEKPGGNITGVSSFIPTFEQIDSIKLLLPKAEKVGVIYNGVNQTSSLQVEIAQKEAETKENAFKFETYPITSSSEISSTLDEMLDDGIDTLFFPVDNLVSEDSGEIFEWANENKIPTICGNEDIFNEGGFSVTKINYTSIGSKAADLVVDIAVNGKKPADIPVFYISDCDTVVSKKVMDKLGIKLTENARNKCIIQ